MRSCVTGVSKLSDLIGHCRQGAAPCRTCRLRLAKAADEDVRKLCHSPGPRAALFPLRGDAALCSVHGQSQTSLPGLVSKSFPSPPSTVHTVECLEVTKTTKFSVIFTFAEVSSSSFFIFIIFQIFNEAFFFLADGDSCV